jgi:uncharacterized protein YndB with AHSA1/START domain
MTERLIERKMQHVLDSLNLSYKVVWTPSRDSEKHGLTEESSRTIFLFDTDEGEAWTTFEHEILELRLKTVTDVYREFSNSLIEAFERLVYKRKEQFLDSIPDIVKIIEESRKR